MLADLFQAFVDWMNFLVWEVGLPVGDGEYIPWVVILLLGTGIFLTLRLGFIQFRRLGHGFAVTSGKYDDPDEPGDVPHFQALTTALSATVGIGNIAGVALAIHFGGPGALFWMWVTAFLGMATKYAEVTLAQRYRAVGRPSAGAKSWMGTVSGGPMYYIEKGLGPNWKPVAGFFAVMLILTLPSSRATPCRPTPSRTRCWPTSASRCGLRASWWPPSSASSSSAASRASAR